MPVRVQIDGVGTAELDDSFRQKSPDEQQAIVDDIANQHNAAQSTAPARGNVSSPAGNWSNIGAENLQQAGIASQPQQPTQGGAVRNFAAGTVDALTSIPGFLANLGTAQANAESGYAMMPDHSAPPQVGGDIQHFLNQQLGRVDLNPESVTANTTTERLARAAGYGAAMVATPELAAAKGATLVQRGLQTVKAGLTGAAGGVGSEVAQEVTPDPYKPIAGLVGGLAGGVTGALATEAPSAVRAAYGAAARSVGPITDAGAQRMAAQRMATSAADPNAVRAALQNVPEMVPGSKPTTFQATGDMGLGALEREVQTKNPAEFAQRRADQNAARLNQLDSLQPQGSPADLPDYIRGQMRGLDQQTEQDVANATQLAQQRTEALGGAQPPEHYGVNLRLAAQQAADDARTRERSLWKAVDPNGDLTVNAAPIRSAAQDIVNSVSGSARPISGDEKAIFDIAKGYNPTVPFRDIGDLRSFVSDAMRTELRTNGQTQTYGRLTRLRGAIEGAINGAVEQQAQEAPQQLQDGVAAFERWIGKGARDWSATRASDSAGVGIAEPSGTGVLSPVSGSQSQAGGQLRSASSDQGLQGLPTFDPAAAERLRLATQATRDRADTFGRGPVGQVLAKAGRQDQYGTSDAAVPAKIFQPGPTGFESVQSYRNAVGDPQAMLTLQDYAASSLRQYAGRLDGTLDPAKVQSWTQRHAEALRAFPDLANRFRDAATASDAIGDAMTARRTALDAYQTGVFSKLVGVSNPDDVTRAIGGILNSQTRTDQMRQLAFTARRNPNAFAGLRKGVADYIQNRFVSTSESATSGNGTIKGAQFQTFIRDHEQALRYVFNPDEMKSLKAIASDLQRSDRSLSAVKIPGQSNTAQDVAALQKGQPSILLRLLSQGAGAAATWITTGSPVWGWLGVKTIGAFRDAGMKRVDDVLRMAMLNPELPRALLEKVPSTPDTGTAARLAAVLRKSTLTGPAVGAINSAATHPAPAPQAKVVSAPQAQNALAIAPPRPTNALIRSPMNAVNALTKAPPPIDNRPANNSLARRA